MGLEMDTSCTHNRTGAIQVLGLKLQMSCSHDNHG